MRFDGSVMIGIIPGCLQIHDHSSNIDFFAQIPEHSRAITKILYEQIYVQFLSKLPKLANPQLNTFYLFLTLSRARWLPVHGRSDTWEMQRFILSHNWTIIDKKISFFFQDDSLDFC